MKKLLFFCLCSFLSYQLLAQPFQIKQITRFNYDSRGAAFPTYPYGFSFLSNPPIFYEAHNGNSVNIMMMSYNPFSDSFYNPVPITVNNFKNINPISSFTNKINLIWQTNENGNWDIALKTLTDSGWSNKKNILDSPTDEINPKAILKNYWSSPNDFEIEILYERENSIYLYQRRDSTINHEKVFSANDTSSYSQPTGVYFIASPGSPPNGLYVAAKCKSFDSTSRIVYRYKAFNGSTWSQILRAYDSGYCNKPQFFNPGFGGPALNFEKTTGDKRFVYIIPEMSYLGQDQYAVRLDDDSTVSTSDLSSFNYAFITLQNSHKNLMNNLDFPIYSPNTYKLIKNDSVFTIYSPLFWLDHVLFYTKVPNDRPAIGNLGVTQNFSAVAYTVWEDSSNGRINLFGVRRLDPLGDIQDKILAENFVLYQNYPNPFNPKTVIKYNLLSRDYVWLKVYDMLGKEVSTLVNEEKSAGEYSVVFDGSNLASGMYVYRLSVGNNHLSRKMILLK